VLLSDSTDLHEFDRQVADLPPVLSEILWQLATNDLNEFGLTHAELETLGMFEGIVDEIPSCRVPVALWWNISGRSLA
jgi:hypothetical protein